MLNPDTPLDRRVIAHTQDFCDAENFIEHSVRAKIKSLVRKDHQINLRANCYASPNSAAWFCSYGVPIVLQFPEENIYRIQFHHRGQGSTVIGKTHYAVSPDQAVITRSATQINFGDNFEQTVLRFSQTSLEKKLAALTGVSPTHPLEFHPSLDLTTVRNRNLKRTFDFFLREVNAPASEIPVLVLYELEQSLMTSFLCVCTNDYTPLLERQAAGAAPVQIRLIEDYIESNWDKPIAIEDLVALSGCPARSIYRAFQQTRGYSPKMFLRRVRLRRAQEMLLTNNASVTEVALICGFSDLGRFSQTYQRMFGELPSHTLKHRK